MMENISPSLDPGTKDLMLCGLEHGIAPKKDVGEGVSITMLGVVTQDEPQHCCSSFCTSFASEDRLRPSLFNCMPQS